MPDPTYEVALEAVRTHLGAPAFEHSVSVANEASALADIYDVDTEAARLAGLLHDWARDTDPEVLIAQARAAGHAVTAADERVPYLLHATIGAAQLKIRFPGLSDQVVRAVERHTTGAVDMSALDMVVYLADMLEPTRSFEGVDGLRDLVGAVPLSDLYARAYALSVHHLVNGRKVIHPSTVDAWNSIVSGERR